MTDLTPSQRAALEACATHQAVASFLPRKYVARTVQLALERKGLVMPHHEPGHPFCLKLTDAGWEAVRRDAAPA